MGRGFNPVAIEDGGTSATTPFSARRALGISEGASTDDFLFAGDMSPSASSAVNTSVITDILALARTKGSKTVVMPGGIFSVAGFRPPGTAPIATDFPSQGITLRGSGDGYQQAGSTTRGIATILRFTSGATSGIGGSTTSYGIYQDNAVQWCNFADFMIDGNSVIDYGLRITSQINVRRITSRGCNVGGFRGQTMDTTYCERLVGTSNAGAGIVIDHASASDSTNATPNTVSLFVGCVFSGNTGAGMVLNEGSFLKFLSNVIQSNTSFGVTMKTASGLPGPNSCEFDSCWLEGNGGGVDKYQVVIDSLDASPNYPSFNKFRNCRMDPLTTNKTIHIVKGIGNIFEDNQYTAGAVGAIDLDAGASDNRFKGVMVGTITDAGNRNYQYDRWVTPSFSAGNFTANRAMTWTVDSGDVATYIWSVREKMMTIAWWINTTTVGGTLNTNLQIAIPNGFLSAGQVGVPFTYSDNGAQAFGFATVSNGAANVTLQTGAAVSATTGNWSGSTNNTAVAGSITFPVQNPLNT